MKRELPAMPKPTPLPRHRHARTFDVKPGRMREYNDEVQAQLRHSVWSSGCDSWYKTAEGRITNNWPRFTVSYWREMRHPDFEEFEWGGPASGGGGA